MLDLVYTSAPVHTGPSPAPTLDTQTTSLLSWSQHTDCSSDAPDKVNRWRLARKEPSLPSRTVLSALTGKCLGRQQPSSAQLTWGSYWLHQQVHWWHHWHQDYHQALKPEAMDDCRGMCTAMRKRHSEQEIRRLWAQWGQHWPRISGMLNEHMPRKSIATSETAGTHGNCGKASKWSPTTGQQYQPVTVMPPCPMRWMCSTSGLKQINNMMEKHPPPGEQVLCLTMAEVTKTLHRVNPCKAAGPDNVPMTVLKGCADQLADVLMDIFNISLSSATIPLCFKTVLLAF